MRFKDRGRSHAFMAMVFIRFFFIEGCFSRKGFGGGRQIVRKDKVHLRSEVVMPYFGAVAVGRQCGVEKLSIRKKHEMAIEIYFSRIFQLGRPVIGWRGDLGENI